MNGLQKAIYEMVQAHKNALKTRGIHAVINGRSRYVNVLKTSTKPKAKKDILNYGYTFMTPLFPSFGVTTEAMVFSAMAGGAAE